MHIGSELSGLRKLITMAWSREGGRLLNFKDNWTKAVGWRRSKCIIHTYAISKEWLEVLYLKDIWNDGKWIINYDEMNKEAHCLIWWDVTVSLAAFWWEEMVSVPVFVLGKSKSLFWGGMLTVLREAARKNDKGSVLCEISTHKSTRRRLTCSPNKLLTMAKRRKNVRRKKSTAVLNAKEWYTHCCLKLGQLQLCHTGFLFPNELYLYRWTCLSERISVLLFSLLSQDSTHFILEGILLSKAALDVRSWRLSVETFVNAHPL